MKKLEKDDANVTHFIPTCEEFNKTHKCLCESCNLKLFFVRFDKDTKNIWIDVVAEYNGEMVSHAIRKAIKSNDYRYSFLMNVFRERIGEIF